LKLKVLFAIGIVLVIGILYFFNPEQHRVMPKCPFKILTGLSCPGCGIQRAIHALLMGDVRKAIGYNYFLVFAGPYALSFIVLYFMPESQAKQRMTRFLNNKYLVNFFIASFFIWLIVRNYFNL
jgi:hypothetical protein